MGRGHIPQNVVETPRVSVLASGYPPAPCAWSKDRRDPLLGGPDAESFLVADPAGTVVKGVADNRAWIGNAVGVAWSQKTGIGVPAYPAEWPLLPNGSL